MVYPRDSECPLYGLYGTISQNLAYPICVQYVWRGKGNWILDTWVSTRYLALGLDTSILALNFVEYLLDTSVSILGIPDSILGIPDSILGSIF